MGGSRIRALLENMQLGATHSLEPALDHSNQQADVGCSIVSIYLGSAHHHLNVCLYFGYLIRKSLRALKLFS